jgi:hypothetical protein
MNRQILFGIIVGSSALAALVIWPAWSTLLIVLLLLGVIGTGWFARRTRRIVIQERRVGVLFDRHGNFHSFIPPGEHYLYQPGMRLAAIIPTNLQRTSERFQGIRTKEGISIVVPWTVTFQIDGEKLLSEQNLAHAYPLLSLPPKRVRFAVFFAIRNLIEKMEIRELYVLEDGSNGGVLTELEKKVTETIQESLAGSVYLIPQTGRVTLGPLELPRQIEKGIEAAYERELHTTAISEAMTRLQAVVKDFDEAHIRRLAELERLRIFGKQGGSLVYKTKEKINGSDT